MRPSEKHRNSQACHQLQSALTRCIGSIVVEDNGLGSPVDIFMVELEDQLPQEDFHDLVVGVRLNQGKISLASRV